MLHLPLTQPYGRYTFFWSISSCTNRKYRTSNNNASTVEVTSIAASMLRQWPGYEAEDEASTRSIPRNSSNNITSKMFFSTRTILQWVK